MKESHVEIINPMERLSTGLGGTGYVGPMSPATALDLRANAIDAARKSPDLNTAIWKVLRDSVNWKRFAKSRIIRVEDRVVPCDVIGGTRDWWFVAVNATHAAKVLG